MNPTWLLYNRELPSLFYDVMKDIKEAEESFHVSF
jgi:hypothetical protein